MIKKFLLVLFGSLLINTNIVAKDIFVSPLGSDSNTGQDVLNPLFTIQSAVNLALPGDTILLAPGRYTQDVHSVRNGTQDKPIRIVGKINTVVVGGGSSHIFDLNHNYIQLIGFTFDGLFAETNAQTGYRDKLLYVKGTQNHSGPIGVKITRMQFRNAGGECLRLRYFVQHSEISFSTFNQCGVHDFRFQAGGKNGEAIYIGTSSKQWQDGKNPTADPDQSNFNWIHHNIITTQGNECVDIKEGSSFNVIEHNQCTGQLDDKSAGFDSRGDHNIFRFNRSYGNEGAGVRLGGHLVGGTQYGANNYVYRNIIHHNQIGGIKFQVANQLDICGNVFFDNLGSDSTGSYRSNFQPSQACPMQQKLPIISVSYSSDESDAGNVASNTIDGNLMTRWSAKGVGEWIEFELDQIYLVYDVKIAWHKGDQRVQDFQIFTSADRKVWHAYTNLQSSGVTLEFQHNPVEHKPVRYVKIVGQGNTQNTWTSVNEVIIEGR